MPSRTGPPRPPSPRFQAGLAHLDAGRTGLARRAFLRSFQEGEERSVWALQQFALVELGHGRSDEIEDYFKLTLPTGAALLEHLIGFIKRRTGRLREARDHFERAVKLDPRLWPAANELGYLRCRQGEMEAGMRLLRSTAAKFRRGNDEWGMASSFVLAATVALTRYELEKARALFTQAIVLKRRCGDRFTLAHALGNLGHVHYYLGNYREAIDAYEEDIALMQGRRDEIALGQAWQGLANAHADLGEWPDAIQGLRKAIRHFRRGGRKDLLSLALVSLGGVLRDTGDRRRALQNARAANALGAVSEDADLGGQTVVFLAEILTKCGRSTEARGLLSRWLRERPAPGQERTEIVLAREQARAACALGLWTEAEDAARRCRVLAQALPDSGLALIQDWIAADTMLGRALLETSRRESAVQVLRQAEREVERLLERQRGAPMRIGLLETYSSVHASLIDGYLVRPSPRAARRAWLVASQLKGRELSRQIELGPATRSVARAEAPVGIGRLLGSEQALLEYHVSPERTRVFLVLEDSVTVVDLGISGTRLAALVDRLVSPLSEAGAAIDAAVHLDAYDYRLAERLGRRLLLPVLARLPEQARRLILVPHGPLHALPFELLPIASAGPEYLVDRFEVSYAPSSSVLRRSRPLRLRPRVLSACFSPDRPVGVPGSSHRRIGTLPAAAREARRIARTYPDSCLIAGRSATVASFQARARGSDIVHISVHAVPDPSAPLRRALVMAPDGPGSEYSLLGADAIARTRLRAALVALSACSTQTGRQRANEGTLGLARAFLEAGTESVLASRWPIDDEASELLATAFHAAVKRNRGFAAALAEARSSLRKSHRHPFYWAPFLLIERVIRPMRGTAPTVDQ